MSQWAAAVAWVAVVTVVVVVCGEVACMKCTRGCCSLPVYAP